MNKLHYFSTSSSLEVKLSRTNFIIFGHNKRILNLKAFNLDKDQIEITNE